MLSETCLEVPDELGNESFIDKEHSLDYKIEKMINLVKLSRKTILRRNYKQSQHDNTTILCQIA